jgi:hypothetical protein
MDFRPLRALSCAVATGVLVLGLAACGGGSKASSASDKASGLTVSLTGDRVTLKRSAASTSGTGGTSGQVACTDDYHKLVNATAVPAPTEAWYAVTFITWPAANAASTATLSHSLKNNPDLCVAQTSDTSTQVVVYFRHTVKTGIEQLQQSTQSTAALQAAAQAAVAAEKKGAFPAVAALISKLNGQGFYVKQTAALSGATETGTMYVITSETTTKKLVVALRDAKSIVHTVTQGLTGKATLGTAKP